MSPTGGANHDRSSVERSPDQFYRSARQSLRPLPQAPAASPPTAKRYSPHHARSKTIDNFAPSHSEDPFITENLYHEHEKTLSRPQIRHANTGPHPSPFLTPDLQDLQKSSTGHLRALSKLAQNNAGEDFSITAPAPSVVGLHGRRQLKRTDSSASSRGKVALTNGGRYGWGERNWMDKQRQYLQAYEYLCHIGEAKEWIEDIIHKPIPEIVRLEEALRDGVTLAEVVQAFYPNQQLRIYRHEKLQFRHSDNIALFFRFLDDIELPDLFRFELIDLYEKKNIPKVIYCIHALSWLLYRKGMVDFRIGNLVGQLQFEHHELEQTQKGLDKSGLSMPSFSGMGASFGAEPEPEPEPVETEDERVDRKLRECEFSIKDFQSQARAALVRLRLGNNMNDLWDAENMLIELQSMIRGDWARQIIGYRLRMQRFAVGLQAAARGFVARSRQQSKQEWWKSKEADILKLQSLARARKARVTVSMLKTQARKQESGIRELQAAIRGALARREAYDQYEATREAEDEVQFLQAAMRGMLERARFHRDKALLARQSQRITTIQAAARALAIRSERIRTSEALFSNTRTWTALQAVLRGKEVRDHISLLKKDLRGQGKSVSLLQASIRGAVARENFHALKLALFKHSTSIALAQTAARGHILRKRIEDDQRLMSSHSASISRLQALSRGAVLRQQVGAILRQIDDTEPEIVQLQALSQAMMLRHHIGQLLSELDQHDDSIIELQSAMRGLVVRSRFAEKQRFFKENMEKVVKIQSIVRAKIQGEAYKSLTNGKNPPVGTLKGFVHLLNDSDFDFDEEVEFERLRKTVVQHVRQNEMADQYITQLDIKIALLVKNKITLDEVVKHQKHFGGHVGTLLPNTDISSKDPFDLKALNKTSRAKLEHYQELFFLLQTHPQYLARLFRRLREHATAEKECERIKHLIMGLYGYAQKRREEYYLVKLIVRSLKEEIDTASSFEEYLRTNCFFNKLFAASIKSPRDRKFMRDVLGALVKENFIDNRALDLESDPVQIYRSAIGNEELRTGKQSRRNPNVPREEAIRDPETRATFIHHMQELRDITDQFFLCLEEALHRMPFAVRFIAQQTYEQLLARFRDEEPGHILQLVGQWIWRNYLQPALTEPEKFGVVDRALTQEQKRNLGEVSKVLTQAVSGREFGGENVYLQPLNTYIRESVYRFGEIWNHGQFIR
jgi:Ras GTPase-activating-like protein IQGAP2/3